MVASLLQQLSASRKHLLYLRFVEGLSQSAIAAQLGVSQMQVSRLLTATFANLRDLLTDQTIAV